VGEDHGSVEEHEGEERVQGDFHPPGPKAVTLFIDPPPERVDRPGDREKVVEPESGPGSDSEKLLRLAGGLDSRDIVAPAMNEVKRSGDMGQ
jgi:hypothetical protein